ncbi:hypothetical protein BGW38_010302 [Lunasporangiospora selenospora]|uniref:IST1 homolog n=1 Tax=Lunasporangiospora selenospora TaxID=979761 RepID=A0A9P6KIP9_9FUNG|nr:hypothetical protein BGW38_010302 [Lunasporangiospora selenospora]
MFNPTRTKVQLKLSVNRLQLQQNRRNTLAQQHRREIARLLEIGKEESARIRASVESIIRDDFLSEALEIIELYCELLLARFGLLEQLKNCDPAIIEAVNTIIYAAPRSEVKELLLVRDQLGAKFGRDFVTNASENKDDSVNPRVIQKLKVQTPDPYLVNRYLEEIAKAFRIAWTADPDTEHQLIGTIENEFIDPVHVPVGLTGKSGVTGSSMQPPSMTHAVGSGSIDLLGDLPSALTLAKGSGKSLGNAPKSSQLDNAASSAQSTSKGGDDGLPDLEALTRRFEALSDRRKK